MSSNLLEDMFMKEPMKFYDYLLLSVLPEVYTGVKKVELSECYNYSSLLIDKFAIHSSSFFHLSNGIIEHRKSNEQKRMNGYDVFTVNTTFRAIMETYATFNNLFVEPESENEREFRFLLWKIDGLNEKSRFDIQEDDFEGVNNILENDKRKLQEIITDLENCHFFKSLPNQELKKIYNPIKKNYTWRFIYSNGEIIPLNITKLIAHTFKTRGFINLYRHTSIHIHSNYYSLEEFERLRGKVLSDEHIDPYTRHAILTTILMIIDICKISESAKIEFESMPLLLKKFLNGIYQSIKKS